MKSTSNTTPKIIALLMFAVTGLAYASGTHSGGHGHDTDETMIETRYGRESHPHDHDQHG